MIPRIKVSFFNKYSLSSVLLLLCIVAFSQIATVDQTRRSLVRIQTVFGDCHGVLINTTDGRQLVLSARHCFDDNFGLGRFTFGGLEWLPGSSIRQSSWATSWFVLLAESKDQDYVLFQLPARIPEQFLPFAAGWNANSTSPLSTYGFSVIADSLVNYEDINRPRVLTNEAIVDLGGTPVENGAWWIRNWEQGFTAVGSSGAPLFDQWSRVVGVLSAGASTPDAPFNDFFSRMDLIYQEEAIQTNLDPENTTGGKLNGQERYAHSKIKNYNDQTFVRGSIGAFNILEQFNLPGTTIYGVYVPIDDIDPLAGITIRVIQQGTVLLEQNTNPAITLAQQENYFAFPTPLTLSGPIEIQLINNGSASFPLLDGPTAIIADNLVIEGSSIGLGILSDELELTTDPTDLLIYPNPVQNNLYIEGAAESDEFHFLDTQGKEVFPRITTDYLGRQVFNVDSFTDGIYLLILPSDEVIRLFIDN